MSIKYAVLGLLAERAGHGYAVHASFEARLSDFWELNYGQVYQVLMQLEREQLVAAHDEREGRRPTRKVYSVTPKGRDALRTWLAKPTERRRPFRDDFYVRLLFADLEDGEALRVIVDLEIAKCRERLAELVDRRDRRLGEESPTIVSQLFGKAAVLHAEADLEALRQCRAALTSTSAVVVSKRPDAKVASPRAVNAGRAVRS